MLSILAIICVWVNDLPLGWRLGVTIPFGLWLLFEIIFFTFDLDGLEKIPNEERPAKSSKKDTAAKLKELEGAEENLGCPVDVLLKALTQGVYAKYTYTATGKKATQLIGHFYVSLARNYDGLRGWYLTTGRGSDPDYWALKDCGKIWALTKEELE